MTPELLARQTGYPVELWRDAEVTLGPRMWPLLWRDVASISARIGASPASVASALVAMMDKESAS